MMDRTAVCRSTRMTTIVPDAVAEDKVAGADEVAALRLVGRPTIPFLLGEDKAANPFLRADDPVLARRYGLEGADPAEVFAAIRKGKDNF